MIFFLIDVDRKDVNKIISLESKMFYYRVDPPCESGAWPTYPSSGKVRILVETTAEECLALKLKYKDIWQINR